MVSYGFPMVSYGFPMDRANKPTNQQTSSELRLSTSSTLAPGVSMANDGSLLGGELPTNRKWVSSPQWFQWINPTYPM